LLLLRELKTQMVHPAEMFRMVRDASSGQDQIITSTVNTLNSVFNTAQQWMTSVMQQMGGGGESPVYRLLEGGMAQVQDMAKRYMETKTQREVAQSQDVAFDVKFESGKGYYLVVAGRCSVETVAGETAEVVLDISDAAIEIKWGEIGSAKSSISASSTHVFVLPMSSPTMYLSFFAKTLSRLFLIFASRPARWCRGSPPPASSTEDRSIPRARHSPATAQNSPPASDICR
jgi:hypothetical protein